MKFEIPLQLLKAVQRECKLGEREGEGEGEGELSQMAKGKQSTGRQNGKFHLYQSCVLRFH